MGDTERPTMLTKHPQCRDRLRATPPGQGGRRPQAREGDRQGGGEMQDGRPGRGSSFQNQQPRNAESKSVSIWGQCNQIQTLHKPKAKINLSGQK